MAISFVDGLPTANTGTTDPETIQNTQPTVTDGQLLLELFGTNALITSGLAFLYDGADPATGGWTKVGGTDFGTGASTANVFWKVGAASDTGKVFRADWTSPTTARSTLQGARYSGVAAAGVHAAARVAESGTGGSAHSMPTVNTTEDCLIVHIHIARQTSFDHWDGPAGYTERVKLVQSASGNNVVTIWDSGTPVAAGTGIGGGTYTGRTAANALVTMSSGVYYTLALPIAASSADLAPAGAEQAQTSDVVALIQDHLLTAAAALQAHTSESPALVQQHQLVVADAFQAQTAETTVLGVEGTLGVADATQAQTADSPALVQNSTLMVADAAQTQQAGTPVLAQNTSLTLQSATQAQTAAAPVLRTVFRLWSANTADGASITARTAGFTSTRLAISTSSAMTSPTYVAAQTPDALGRLRYVAIGLASGTQFYYQLADTPAGGTEQLVGEIGKFRTLGGAVLKIAPWGCITTNAADGVAMADLRTWDPDIAPCLGDFTYAGPSSTDAEVHAAAFESQIIGAANLRAMLRDIPVPLMASDHDTIPTDNGDSNNSTNQASIQAYERFAPYAELASSGSGATRKGRWQSVVAPSPSGGIRMIFADSRSMDRSPGLMAQGPTKTHFGAEQLAWLLDELDQPEPLKILFMDVAWMGPASTSNGEDKMWSYANERQTIIDHVAANDIRLELVHSDSHLIGTTARESNAYGNFPVTCSAPMHNVGGGRNPNEFDWFFSNAVGDCRQYIRMTITDDSGAGTITVEKVGWDAAAGISRGSETTVWDVSTLQVDGAAQAQTASSPALIQQHTLAVQGATQAQLADLIGLSSEALLSVQDAVHLQAAGSVVLVQQHMLVAAGTVQAQTSDVVPLAQTHQLLASDAVMALTSDQVPLTTAGVGRNITIRGSIEQRFVGSLEPARLTGAIEWP
jgi:hypothetical protein